MCIAEKVRGNASIVLMKIMLTYENLILIIYRRVIRNKYRKIIFSHFDYIVD